jgi:hypothetical protein|tara:strand:- start:118 stop:300 length:183 start_codon:yes stop_codon:yes gene_type:complete
MGMMFSDMGKTLSVKGCYSKLILSSSVFLLTLLLSVTFFVQERYQDDKATMPPETAALLD